MKITNQETFKSAQRYYLPAETLHAAGVEEFGGLWLGANENIVDIARSWGIDVSEPGARQFFALVAIRTLRAAAPAARRSRLANAICGRSS